MSSKWVWKTAAIAAVVVVGLVAGPAAAQTDFCLNQHMGAAGTTPGCTEAAPVGSNDVLIANVLVASVTDGCGFVGDDATVTLVAELLANATSRQDIGIMVNTQGGSAITGTDACLLDVLKPPGGGPETETCTLDLGTSAADPGLCFRDWDADDCADIQKTDPNAFYLLNGGSDVDIKCVSSPTNPGKVSISGCIVFSQNKFDNCTDASETNQGAGPKCYCDENLTIDVPLPPAKVTIIKHKVIPGGAVDPGTTFNFALDAPDPESDGTFGPLDDLDEYIFWVGDDYSCINHADGPGVPCEFQTFGLYDITETVPGDWNLSVGCTGEPGTPITDGVSLEVGIDDEITCTFTNTLLVGGSVTVQKQSDTGFDDSTEWSYTCSGGPTSCSFGPIGIGETDIEENLEPGTYTITEGAQPNWTAVGTATCELVGNGGARVPPGERRTAAIGAAGSVEVTIDRGEDWLCTFTNRANDATVRIEKTAAFDNGTTFTFGGTPAISGLQAGEFDEVTVAAGSNVSISENVPTNWSLEEINCDVDTSPIANGFQILNIGAGASVTCEFVNVPDNGTITIRKEVDPAESGEEFFIEFDGDFIAGGCSDKADGCWYGDGDEVLYEVEPTLGGDYSAEETEVSNFDLSASCTHGSIGNILVNPGEDVVCTFVNTEEEPIPTLSSIGLVALVLLLGLFAVLTLRRRGEARS